jgi:predicted Rossmann fold nucleotide-binding protein DprA/Smf involved in DNA uptake
VQGIPVRANGSIFYPYIGNVFVTSRDVADIQEELPVFGSLSVPTSTKRTTDRDHDTLLDAIDYIPTSVDQIIVRSGLTAAKVCSILIRMEIAGKIRNCEGRYLRNLES